MELKDLVYETRNQAALDHAESSTLAQRLVGGNINSRVGPIELRCRHERTALQGCDALA